MIKTTQILVVATMFLMTVYLAVDRSTANARALEPSVIDTCRGCHSGPRDLSDLSVDEIDQVLAEIAAGEIDHVAPLPPLSDADRRELAEALAGQSPES